jgi:hypothetical protein
VQPGYVVLQGVVAGESGKLDGEDDVDFAGANIRARLMNTAESTTYIDTGVLTLGTNIKDLGAGYVYRLMFGDLMSDFQALDATLNRFEVI